MRSSSWDTTDSWGEFFIGNTAAMWCVTNDCCPLKLFDHQKEISRGWFVRFALYRFPSGNRHSDRPKRGCRQYNVLWRHLLSTRTCSLSRISKTNTDLEHAQRRKHLLLSAKPYDYTPNFPKDRSVVFGLSWTSPFVKKLLVSAKKNFGNFRDFYFLGQPIYWTHK